MAYVAIGEGDNIVFVKNVGTLGDECKSDHTLTYDQAVEFQANLSASIKEFDRKRDGPKIEGLRLA